jgi:hypothetical protein
MGHCRGFCGCRGRSGPIHSKEKTVSPLVPPIHARSKLQPKSWPKFRDKQLGNRRCGPVAAEEAPRSLRISSKGSDSSHCNASIVEVITANSSYSTGNHLALGSRGPENGDSDLDQTKRRRSAESEEKKKGKRKQRGTEPNRTKQGGNRTKRNGFIWVIHRVIPYTITFRR